MLRLRVSTHQGICRCTTARESCRAVPSPNNALQGRCCCAWLMTTCSSQRCRRWPRALPAACCRVRLHWGSALVLWLGAMGALVNKSINQSSPTALVEGSTHALPLRMRSLPACSPAHLPLPPRPPNRNPPPADRFRITQRVCEFRQNQAQLRAAAGRRGWQQWRRARRARRRRRAGGGVAVGGRGDVHQVVRPADQHSNAGASGGLHTVRLVMWDPCIPTEESLHVLSAGVVRKGGLHRVAGPAAVQQYSRFVSPALAGHQPAAAAWVVHCATASHSLPPPHPPRSYAGEHLSSTLTLPLRKQPGAQVSGSAGAAGVLL